MKTESGNPVVFKDLSVTDGKYPDMALFKDDSFTEFMAWLLLL